MNLPSKIYMHYLNSTGLTAKFWSVARKVLIKAFDPVCSIKLHGIELKIPLSHSLPIYLKKFPFYDSLPRRINLFLHKKIQSIHCIDVGANIGDTIASFYLSDEDYYLAVEPNPSFFSLLQENWSWNKNITAISDVCRSQNEKQSFIIKELNGTASIEPLLEGAQMTCRTLDDIARSCGFEEKVDILKIDTDGSDFDILAGAKKTLSHQPAVLFECDLFGNPDNIVKACETTDLFVQSGYNNFLIYDNLGYMIGLFSLKDKSVFNDFLMYQMSCKSFYYDILVMRDEDIFDFHVLEKAFFSQNYAKKY